MRKVIVVSAAIALGCAVAAESVQAQTPISWDIRSDNDAFNFWTPPYKRPDEEYTSGVRAALEFSGSAPWERWLHGKVLPCAVGVSRCSTHTYAFGQDIYTGKLVPGDTTKIAGTRPNAGWLFVQEGSKVETRDRLDESSVTVGVVGPPALAEQTQTIVHAIAPYYNRPTNWSTQLPFEPGIVAAFDRTQRLLSIGGEKSFGADVEPHAGASVGSILTEARAGLSARLGYRINHPWMLAKSDSTPAIIFSADATEHAVARNEFLAGTLFRSSEHVTERPFVSEYQLGVTFRLQQFSLSWTAHQLASEYESRANGHAWSRLDIAWRFDR